MRCLKFSFFVWMLLIFSVKGEEQFSELACINASFSTQLEHKGAPFGLTSNKLAIKKENCEIVINYSKLKFLKDQWLIDVCREPVHIKSGANSITVLKRNLGCKSNGGDYCDTVRKIRTILQDKGLIFAKGEKEYISTDHGKIYCVYTLLTKYLDKGVVLNRHAAPPAVKTAVITIEDTPMPPPSVEAKSSTVESISKATKTKEDKGSF